MREALATPGAVVEVYATAAAAGRHPALRDDADAADVAWTEVTDDVVAAIADTVHPQGVRGGLPLRATCRSPTP